MVLKDAGCTSVLLSPRAVSALGSGGVLCFSTLKQLGEDIAAMEALLECRRDTWNILKLHYGPMHKSEVGRLEMEARQVRISLAVAQKASANEKANNAALVDSDSGRRDEADLLVSLKCQD